MIKWYRYIVISIMAIMLLFLYRSYYVEPQYLEIKELSVEVPHWKPELNGLKFIVIGDIHTGSPFNDIERLKSIVKEINSLHPDIVLITGDYVIKGVLGGKIVDITTIAPELKKIKAKLAVVSILGNHDWWVNGDHIRKELEKNGIIVLENDVTQINFNKTHLWIAGVADEYTRNPDVPKTLKKITDNNPVIMLTHNPDVFKKVPQRVSMTFAGHTHGGQITFPIIGSPLVPSKYGQNYRYGIVNEDNKTMYVTSGIGTSILPLRFGTAPEIVSINLKPKK